MTYTSPAPVIWEQKVQRVTLHYWKNASFRVSPQIYCVPTSSMAASKSSPLSSCEWKLTGDRAFADIIELKTMRWDHSGFRVGPNSNGVLIKESKARFQTQRYKEEGHGKTDTHRRRPYQMEVEIGVVQCKSRNVKVCQPPPEPGRGTEQILPRSLQKESVLLTPWLWTSGLHSCERINFCFKSPSLW